MRRDVKTVLRYNISSCRQHTRVVQPGRVALVTWGQDILRPTAEAVGLLLPPSYMVAEVEQDRIGTVICVEYAQKSVRSNTL